MKRIFIDTSAFYALADRSDPLHHKAFDFFSTTMHPLYTNNFIFAETISLTTKRLGKRKALEFGNGIWTSKVIDLVFLPEEYQKLSWELFRSQDDKEWDFIDCTCFVLMEKLGQDTAFSFDRHFTQRGLSTVP